MAQTQSPWKQTTMYSVRYLAELRGRRSRTAVKAVKQRTRSAISIRNRIEHRERRHASRVTVVEQEREIEQDRNNRVRGVRHVNQGRGRCRDNDQRGKGDRHPRNDRCDRRSDRRNRFGGNRLESPQRSQTDRMEQQHAQIWETPDSHVRHQEQFPSRGTMYGGTVKSFQKGMPLIRRKLVLACITREMLHFRSQCLYKNGDQQVQTKRGAIHPQVNCSYETNN